VVSELSLFTGAGGVMMTKDQYTDLRRRLVMAGYGQEIAWAECLKPCDSALDFALEAMWVILCSGMKAQIARMIEEKIYKALNNGQPISSVFGHKGKVKAIEYILDDKHRLFVDFQKATDKLAFLKTLPWIGDITKYHLAKNLGIDVVKPDRHLVRIAAKENKTPHELCKEISGLTGDSLAVVDTVIWRAANLGWL